jgi:hypothetical protein
MKKFHIQIKYSKLIIFWIEILIFELENNNLEFKYQFLDQINFLNLNRKFHMQIIFFKFK